MIMMENKKYKIYLDDLRTPLNDGWIVVRSADEFVKKIQELGIHNVELISFDHDLGPSAMSEWFNNTQNTGILNYDNIDELTGMDCVKWLIHQWIKNDITFATQVHSANPVGSENMIKILNNYYKFKKADFICHHIITPYKHD